MLMISNEQVLKCESGDEIFLNISGYLVKNSLLRSEQLQQQQLALYV
jgi:hypothetical protein